MADSNSQQQRCPCGFWGTPQNQGLCSKCFKDHQKKVEEVEKGSEDCSSSLVSAEAFSKAISQVGTCGQDSKQQDLSTAQEAQSSSGASSGTPMAGEDAQPTESSTSASDNTDAEIAEPADETPSDQAVESKEKSNGNKRDIDEVSDPDKPVQKNKKRCFKCNCKLEVAIREIGRCKCDYIFCQLHRLPEQHDCIYDHKEQGRQEARKKMVSPKKHMGNSLKRIDSDS